MKLTHFLLHHTLVATKDKVSLKDVIPHKNDLSSYRSHLYVEASSDVLGVTSLQVLGASVTYPVIGIANAFRLAVDVLHRDDNGLKKIRKAALILFCRTNRLQYRVFAGFDILGRIVSNGRFGVVGASYVATSGHLVNLLLMAISFAPVDVEAHIHAMVRNMISGAGVKDEIAENARALSMLDERGSRWPVSLAWHSPMEYLLSLCTVYLISNVLKIRIQPAVRRIMNRAAVLIVSVSKSFRKIEYSTEQGDYAERAGEVVSRSAEMDILRDVANLGTSVSG
jgi:hypothetical protein